MSQDQSRPHRYSSETALYRPAAILTVTAPSALSARSVTVDCAGVVIGRDSGCDLALASEHISRQHAAVRVQDGIYVVEDLGSRNGTVLNGTAVTGISALRDGDRIGLAEVEITFQLTGAQPVPPPRRSSPSPDEDWRPQAVTGEQPNRGSSQQQSSLRQELRESRGFSVPTLLYAVGGSVVTAAFAARLTGPWGTLIRAGLAPVVTTTFSTGRTGEKGRLRTAAVVILSLAALVITWGGVSVADVAAGKSVLPGADRGRTFPVPDPVGPANPRPTATASPSATSTASPDAGATLVDCGSSEVGATVDCPPATVRYPAVDRLQITSVAVVGDRAADFVAGSNCDGQWLNRNESCDIPIQFTPHGTGMRTATLVVHQTLRFPDTGTRIRLTGLAPGGGFTITVDLLTNAGQATVVSQPSGISCPGTCQAVFGSGTTITLGIVPDVTGTTAVTWQGCDTSGATCTIRVDRDRTVTAQISG